MSNRSPGFPRRNLRTPDPSRLNPQIVAVHFPSYRDGPGRDAQGSVFGGVGRKLMEHQSEIVLSPDRPRSHLVRTFRNAHDREAVGLFPISSDRPTPRLRRRRTNAAPGHSRSPAHERDRKRSVISSSVDRRREVIRIMASVIANRFLMRWLDFFGQRLRFRARAFIVFGLIDLSATPTKAEILRHHPRVFAVEMVRVARDDPSVPMVSRPFMTSGTNNTSGTKI